MAEGHRRRHKAKIKSLGVESLPMQDLLEFVLYPFYPRIDTVPIAKGLLEHFGSLDKVFNAKFNELEAVGLPETAALYISCMRPIIVRARGDVMQRRGVFDNPRFVGDYYIEKIGCLENEELHAALLDVHYGFLKSIKLFDGDVASAEIDVRRFVTAVIAGGAQKVILTHNHPGMSVMPSAEDIATTRDVGNILSGLDVELVDHIIVAGNESYSMWLNGHLNDIRGEVNLDAAIDKDNITYKNVKQREEKRILPKIAEEI